MKRIGPPLPPHLQKKREEARKQQEQEQEQLRKRKQNRVTTEEDEEKVKGNIKDQASGSTVRIKGCALPDTIPTSPTIGPIGPSPLESDHNTDDDDEQEAKEDEEDEEEEEEGELIGPFPSHHRPYQEEGELRRLRHEFQERAERMEAKERGSQASTPAALERGEWMLVPPSASSVNELQSLKPRKFASKTRNTEFDPTWTQTPQEKREAASSSSHSKSQSRSKTSSRKRSRSPPTYAAESSRDRALSGMIAEYNSQHRHTSLMESYQSNPDYVKRLRQHEAEALSRPFDREKDLAGRAPLSQHQRRELLNQASKMSDKFGHGKTRFL